MNFYRQKINWIKLCYKADRNIKMIPIPKIISWNWFQKRNMIEESHFYCNYLKLTSIDWNVYQLNENDYSTTSSWIDLLTAFFYSSIASKNRSKAIAICMNTLLERHKMRTLNRCLNRWYEHSKLVQIHELYKRDMLANQDEFVYVTW